MIGIGGSTIEKELNAITNKAHLIDPIPKSEFQLRIDNACKLMHDENISAMWSYCCVKLNTCPLRFNHMLVTPNILIIL